MDKPIIEILNWDKFNPRTDVKASSWFRFEHNVFFDPEWDAFDGMEIAVWSYLLAFASFKRGKCKFDYDADSISKYARVPIEKVFSAIEKLVEKQCIKLINPAHVTRAVRARTVDVSLRDETDGTVRDGTRRTVRYVTNSPPPQATAPVAELRDAFLESYRNEFKREYPGWGAKENGMAAKWLKSISLENAKRLCALYPKWNDPWVTKQGHPLGILMAQYVQLDAWAQSSKQLILKIAAGKAAESVDLKRAIDSEEMKRGLAAKIQQRQRSDLGRSGRIPGQLSLATEERIPAIDGDPFSGDIFDPPREDDAS
tara:strand:- start:1446 stop:2384 length:939 start_codon:yes stop_codon:yes gene_type:complete